MHLIYHDHNNNEDVEPGMKPHLFTNSSFKNSSLIAVSIDSKGALKRAAIHSDGNRELHVSPIYASSVNPGVVMVSSYKTKLFAGGWLYSFGLLKLE